MAEYLITGGGAALDDALNKRNGFSYTNGDTLWVGPGIYSPVNFAQYLKNVEVRSTDGKESTIIDGQGLSTCLKNRYSNLNYRFNFYGFTLQNGYISSDLSSPVFEEGSYSAAGAAGSLILYDSNIYDCSAENYYSNPYNNSSYGHFGAIGSNNCILYNCEISGCIGFNTILCRGNSFYNCDFHHNNCDLSNAGDKPIVFGGTMRKCKIHHNSISGIFFTSWPMVDCLIYNNYGTSSNNWIGERARMLNCVIANNVGFALENSFGGSSYWKNVVCYNNKRTNGSYATATIYGNSGRSQIWNCYFDQLSSTITWSGWNELSGNKRTGSIFSKDADFGFVDPTNGDFRLRPDSILIGNGTWDILSGKTPTETSPNYNGTSENAWLSANGDFTSRKWKDPPSVGAYEFIEEKQNMPNDMYPFGRESSIAKMVEIEYLESTGTQYIDAELDYFADFEITIKLKQSVANKALGIDGTNCLQRISSSNPNWRFTFNNSSYDSSIPITEKHTLEWKSNEIKSDGILLTEKTKDFTSGKMILFGSGSTYYPNIIYSCKLYDLNGTLVRDFIPVRIGTTGYLYDKVSKQLFGNKGTGNFTCGPTKQYDAELQYLQSDGSQYIDTGLNADYKLEYEIEAAISSTWSNGIGALATSADPRHYIRRVSSNVGIGLGNNGGFLTATWGSFDTFHTFKVDMANKMAYVDSTSKAIPNESPYTDFNTQTTFCLFGVNQSGVARRGIYKIASAKFWYDGVLVRDYIPVRKNGIGYLFDKVSNRLANNLGIANFILGPDKTS